MKKTLRTLVTLLLVVTMLFGVMSTAVFAAVDTSAENSGSEESAPVGGGVQTDWCEVSYDENGLTVVINPDAQAILGANAEEIKSVLRTLIDAVKLLVIEDIKSGLFGSDEENNIVSGGGVDVEAGTNSENVFEVAFGTYISGKYGNDDSASYVQFLKDLIADDTTAEIGAFVDYVCRLVTSAVSMGYISVDQLPQPEAVESKIAEVFDKELDKRVNDEASKYVGLYVDWLTDDTVVIDASIKNIIDAQVSSYIKLKVSAYVDNGFKAPDDADDVDYIFADYIDAEIYTQVDEWVKNYAAGNEDLNPADINALIDYEIELWVEQIVDSYGKDEPSEKSPIFDMAIGMLDAILDDEVEALVKDYLSGKVINAGVQSAIEGVLVEQAPEFILELYWAHKADGTLSGEFWEDIDAQVKEGAVLIIQALKLLPEADAEAYFYNTAAGTLRAELNVDPFYFDQVMLDTVADTIASYTASDWSEVWNNLTETEQAEVLASVKSSDAFANIISDVIREYWIGTEPSHAEHRHAAIQYILEHEGYEDMLATIIDEAEHKDEYKDVIAAAVDEYLVDVIPTLRAVVSTLDKSALADLKLAIEAQAKTKLDDIIDEAFIAIFGIDEAGVKAKVDSYVPFVKAEYAELLAELSKKPESNGEIDLLTLFSHLQKITVGDTVLFADRTLDLEAVKSFIFELPTFEEIAEKSFAEMKLEYPISIVTDFGTSEFSVTVKLAENETAYKAIIKYAALVAEYVDFDMNEDGVIVFHLTIPEEFAELVLRAANSNRVPDELKYKVFAAFTTTPDDVHAFINDATLEDMLRVFDYVDLDGLLDSDFISNFERLDGLTEEQIKNKIKEYEHYYTKLINLINSLYKKVPDSLKTKTIMDLYDGEGEFAHYGSYSLDVMSVLNRLSSKYADILAGFMSVSSISATVDISVKFESINKIEYVLGDETLAVGLLPAGADVPYFAPITHYDHKLVIKWALDKDGNEVLDGNLMPDADTTVYAILEETVGGVGASIATPDIDKVYDANFSDIRVTVDYGALPEDAEIRYQWYKDGQKLSAKTLAAISVGNVADSGEYYCVVEVVFGDEIVETIETNRVNVKIAKAVLDFDTYKWQPSEFTYDGTIKSVYLMDANGNILSFGLTYKQNSAIDARDYVASVEYTTDNFEVIGTVSDHKWSIKPATYDMSGIKFEDLTVDYDGLPHSITIQGELPEGVTVSYSRENIVAAGVYTIVASFTSDNVNYKEIPDMTATLTIRGYATSHKIFDAEGNLLVEITSKNGNPYDAQFKDKSAEYSYVEDEAIFGAGKVGYVGGAYDIHFVDDAGVLQYVTDEFTVKILLPKNLANKESSLKVVYIAENGSLEEMPLTIDGDYFIFETSHFSTYAIVEIGDAPVVPEESEFPWLWVILGALVLLIVIIVVIKKRKGNKDDESDDSASDEPTDDPEDESEDASEEEDATEEEKTAEESPVEETPTEEASAEETPVEEAPAEEVPVEEAPVAEAPAEETPVEEATVEETPVEAEPEQFIPPIITASEVDTQKAIADEIVHVRFRTSFMSRLIQAETSLQDYYTAVKNALLAYKGVKARTSWNFESFNKGRIQCAKLNIKGNAFQVYLALDPNEYNANKYHFVDVGDKPKLDKVPMLLKVKSERGLKYALELIEEMMNKLGMEKTSTPEVDYHMPYETTEALARRDLVKIILPQGVALDGVDSLVKLDVGALLDSVKFDEASDEDDSEA